MQQLVGMPLPFGQRAARALDVGAGPGMPAVEEQHAGPDVHGLLVAPGEVVIESREQELLDTRIVIANGTGSRPSLSSVRAGSDIRSG